VDVVREQIFFMAFHILAGLIYKSWLVGNKEKREKIAVHYAVRAQPLMRNVE
jgi:hypothetical protein